MEREENFDRRSRFDRIAGTDGTDGTDPGEGILIFAGTTEGRQLAEYASAAGIPACVSTATEYGAEVLKDLEGIRLLSGRLDSREMEGLVRESGVSLVIDATHPFAREVTENIRSACQRAKVSYIRCLREREEETEKTDPSSVPAPCIRVSSVKEAAAFLDRTEGNILITTGSKELCQYAGIRNYRERCFARVLSTHQAVAESVEAGFQGRHLIAMQGPFSEEMNLALLHLTGAKYLVTKESGNQGGFREKLSAAEKAGAVLVMIERPEEEGMPLDQVIERIHDHVRQNQRLRSGQSDL